MGVSNVIVRFDNDFGYTLKKVKSIPYMGRNLIFMGELECTGLVGALGDGV